MILDGLKLLYSSMRNQGIDRYRFDYKHGKANFEVFFLADSEPFILLFGARGHSFSFELKVQRGFRIETKLENDTYKKICALLGLSFDPNNHFSTSDFFSEFNQRIPKFANRDQRVRPEELIDFCRDVEEADKKWFCGWRNNTTRGQCVTFENLEKTKLLLGERAYQICKEKNISTCWTDDCSRAVEVAIPG